MKEEIEIICFLVIGLLAFYGAVMGHINFKIHQALKEYLEAKGLGE